MRINTNVAAMNAYRNLVDTDNSLSRSMERLSSGLRINRAADDSAGLAISEKMRGQIRGLNQAMRNAQDGISLIQTAEGALNETHSILQRMRELAVQSASDTLTAGDRAQLQLEVNQLVEELTRISATTEFNTQKLLDGTYDAKFFHIGANQGQAISLSISDMSATALEVIGADTVFSGTVGTNTIGLSAPTINQALYTAGAGPITVTAEFTEHATDPLQNTLRFTLTMGTGAGAPTDYRELTGAAITGGNDIAFTTGAFAGLTIVRDNTAADGTATITVSGTGVPDPTSGIDISSRTAANAALGAIDSAIDTVSGERAGLGAMQNRLEHTIANLGVAAENLTAAESRIRDLDMAQEMVALTRNQIMMQAGTAMLAQANMKPQSVLMLLS